MTKSTVMKLGNCSKDLEKCDLLADLCTENSLAYVLGFRPQTPLLP